MLAETLEARQMLAGDAGTPIGITTTDTGEFLLGRVLVTPVLFESNGDNDAESQDWTTAEIQEAIDKVVEGVQWWSDALDELNTVHQLEFVFDTQWATTPFETQYEPIDRPSNDVSLAIQEFLTPLGYQDSSSLQNAVHRFNNDQREAFDTDFAFTIFLVDSSDDPDGAFASGGSFSTAFAFSGGLYLISPSTRPASTIAHEMGHIFYARDEYPGGGSWTDQRGYYNTQNTNAADNPTVGFVQEDSIMRAGQPLLNAYESHTSPTSTFAMVGWQDSDGDGVFDVLDVPLELSMTGYFDVATSTYHAKGSATAVALQNLNSAGNQSDITLNTVDRLEYRLDGVNWVSVLQPEMPTAEINVEFVIEDDFQMIEFRVVDNDTGVSSEVVEGGRLRPAVSNASIRGSVYLDASEDADRQSDEELLGETMFVLRNADGSELFGDQLVAADLEPEVELTDLDNVSLASTSVVFANELAVFEVIDQPGKFVFHGFDNQVASWTDQWNGRNALSATFDEPVGTVTVGVLGIEDDSYGRIEAYDTNGNLLSRQTTGRIDASENALLTIADSSGNIAEVRVFGHAGSSVAIESIDFRTNSTATTSDDGTFQFGPLADGRYQVIATARNLTHQVDPSDLIFDVVDGVASEVFLGAVVGTGPRHNPTLVWDVNEDTNVTAQDALLVINDLNRSSPRLLTADELDGFKIDVNNDGQVSALDALLVINALNRRSGDGGAEGESLVSSGADSWVTSAVPMRESGSIVANGVSRSETDNVSELVDRAFASGRSWQPSGPLVGSSVWAGCAKSNDPGGESSEGSETDSNDSSDHDVDDLDNFFWVAVS